MNFIQFLKPDWKKVVIFVLISIVFSFTVFISVLGWPVSLGFPLIFYKCLHTGFYPFGLPSTIEPMCYFNYQALIIDILLWYLLSCFVVWIYDKVKEKFFSSNKK